jgi:hypothetical protein
VVPPGGVAVLSVGVRKAIINPFGLFTTDWGFNLPVCQQGGGCDEARISGRSTDKVTVDWRLTSTNYLTGTMQAFDADGWAAYRKSVATVDQIVAFISKVAGIPVLDKLLGLPDEQGYKVTLKQRNDFAMSLDFAQPAGQPPQVLVNVQRPLRPDTRNFDDFIIDDDRVVSAPYKLLANTCRVGSTSQCQITLANPDGTLNYPGAVSATDRGGYAVSETIGYSAGAFRILNHSGSPLSYTVFVNNRMVANDEVMPDRQADLRDIIGQTMQTVGDQECPQIADPFMPGRRMGACPFRLSFQVADAKGTLNCTLSARQGTVVSPGEDKLNLYLLRSCQPQSPIKVGDRTQLRVDQFIQLSGMYKMVSLTFAPLPKE